MKYYVFSNRIIIVNTHFFQLSEAGMDGHPRRGSSSTLIPDIQGKRMWAGGRISWHNANFKVGDTLTRSSELLRIEKKRNGELTFVTLRHIIGNSSGGTIVEEQDLVYKAFDTKPKDDDDSKRVKTPQPLPPIQYKKKVVADDVMLFRYSAMMFNSHRIHFDRFKIFLLLN